MSVSGPGPAPAPGRFGVAFLLTQLGSRSAERYAASLTELQMSPPLAGVMRLLRAESGLSQQQLADRLGSPPSRVVGYLDDLQAKGWVTRSQGPTDRRVNVIALTEAGRTAFERVAQLSREHELKVTAGLDDDEYEALKALLQKLATTSGLSPGVHPGYRQPTKMPADPGRDSA